MGKRKKGIIACVVAGVAVIAVAAGAFVYMNQKETDECPYEEFIVVDVFDSLANYQGIQSGWFAKLVKDKFNMELNIIAPNVAGGGDTLFEIRSAAGNLGDLIVYSNDSNSLETMISSGLVLNMEPYIKDKSIMRFEKAIEGMNEHYTPAGIYSIPHMISNSSPLVPSEEVEPTYGPYIRWDLYKQLGYPQMDTLEDMLPVLKQMQELEPVAENGNKTYAFSLFRDWDRNLMNAGKQPCCFYGYDEFGFALVKADGSEYQSILDADSMYMRVLKWYFDANQMGLVDPESPNQNYERLSDKYENGQVLYSPWPWQCQTSYNTASRMQEGKGFMMADIEDMTIYSYGCCPDGDLRTAIAVGSQAKDPERLVDFIDWLYSPEGIAAMGANSMSGTAGLKGLCWDYGDNGPYLTEFGEKVFYEGNAEVPEEWGGGLWTDGIAELNFQPVNRSEKDDLGYSYYFSLWPSIKTAEPTVLEKDWQEYMQAETTMDYLIDNDKLAVAPGCSYVAPAETAEESAIRKQCRSSIQKYSWQMIFAEDEDEFYRLQEELQKETASIGYEQIYALDLKNAMEKEDLRRKIVEEYENEQ